MTTGGLAFIRGPLNVTDWTVTITMKLCERGILSGEVSRCVRAFLLAATHDVPLVFLAYYDFIFRKTRATTLDCEQRAGRTHGPSVAATACIVTVTFPTRDSFA